MNEPSRQETLEILRAGYVKRFTERRQIAIDPGAVEAAVELSARYLPDRRLPDKDIVPADSAGRADAVRLTLLAITSGMRLRLERILPVRRDRLLH